MRSAVAVGSLVKCGVSSRSGARHLLVPALLLLGASIAPGGPPPDPCIVTDVGGTVSLPPEGCEYLTADQVHMIMDGLPPGTMIELAPIHKDFICRKQIPPGSPICGIPDGSGGMIEVFESTLAFNYQGIGIPVSGSCSIPVFCQTQTDMRMVGDPVQSFDTEMLSLQGQLTPCPPHFDLLRVTAGTNFGLPSPGHTTLTQAPGGNWHVDSFFDITYRIDFVGAPGSVLGGMSGSTTGTIRMEAGAGAGGVCETKPEQTSPSTALIDVDLGQFGRHTLQVSGDVTTAQGALSQGQIPTEILSMSLRGAGPFPDSQVEVRLDPTRPSLGAMQDVAPAATGECAARAAFFDVFVEIDLQSPLGNIVVTTLQPVQMRGTDIPVCHTRPFDLIQVNLQPVQLVDVQGLPVGQILNTVHHVDPPPCFKRGDANCDGCVDDADAQYLLDYLFRAGPPPCCDDAADVDDNGDLAIADADLILAGLPTPECAPDPTRDNLVRCAYPKALCDRVCETCDCPYGPGTDTMDSRLDHEIVLFGMPDKICSGELSGLITVERGSPQIGPDGLCCVPTRITSLTIDGDDPVCGPISIRLCPERPSTGFICQKPGVTGCFPAQSCFNIYLEIRVMGMILKNCEPAVMCCMIDRIPPFGCLYQLDLRNLPLYRAGDCGDPTALPVGEVTQQSKHEPRPCKPIVTCTLDAAAGGIAVTVASDPTCTDPCEAYLVTVTNPDGTTIEFPIPGAQTGFTVPCPEGGGLVKVCVRCVIAGVASAECCCEVQCAPPCDPRCQTLGCCQPTGCAGVRVQTILPPDRGEFDVFILLQSWCNGQLVKECKPSFHISAGEQMTPRDKCLALVEAIRTQCAAAGYVVEPHCDVPPPSGPFFIVRDVTCPGAKVVMGIANDPNVVAHPPGTSVLLPDYESEVITPLCADPACPPVNNIVVSVPDPAAVGQGFPVEEMTGPTVAVEVHLFASIGSTAPPVRVDLPTMPNMTAEMIAAELAARLMMQAGRAAFFDVFVEGPTLQITNVRPAGPIPAGGAGFDSPMGGAGGATNDDGVFIGNFGGPTIIPSEGLGPFVRGDVDGSGDVPGTTADIIRYANVCFLGTGVIPCRAAADVNGDGQVCGSVTDIVYLAGFLFLGQDAPPSPFPGCALSADADDLALGCGTPPCP